MLGTLHNDLYFQRMAASLGDKSRLLGWLAPGSILDIGAGDGMLVAATSPLTEGQSYGLDAASEAVSRSNGLVRLGTSPGIRIAFPNQTFGNIIMSSVLHEIHSYNQPRGLMVSMIAINEAATALQPGGRLLIRDGVGPDDRTTWCRISFREPSRAREFHSRWHDISKTLGPDRPSTRTSFGTDERLYGLAADLTAFLFVYVWGDGSIEREAQEDYTCAGPLDVRSEQLEGWSGLDLIHAEAYQQPGYVEHWERLCRFEHQLTPHQNPWTDRDWPMTNAIWILERNNQPIINTEEE